MQNKLYIKLFGINLIRIKKRFENTYKISILGIPVFSYEIKDNKHIINFWVIYKTIYVIKKLYLKAKKKAFKIQLAKKYANNEKVKVCIMVQRPGIWNFDSLYKIFDNDKHFEVFAFIAPEHAYGEKIQKEYLDEISSELQSKNIKFYLGYQYESDAYIDLRNELNPDVILYTDFNKFHFYEQYYITNFQDKLTLLTEYGFSNMQDEFTCNFELNWLVDTYFRPTTMHLDMAKKYMKNKGKNVKIVGHPKLDSRFDEDFKPVDIWKIQDKPKKRIIWAPHRSDNYPKDRYQYNGFYVLYDYMFELAKKYENEVQFVFRPHPVLKSDLYKRWGVDRTNEYYKKWDEYSNCQYFEGNFIDLFMTSDAMITDSCSFLAEYTAFNKPLFHTVTPTSRTKLNEFGEELYKVFYKPKGTEEGDLEKGIEEYIQNVVLGGNDIYKEQRTELVNKYFGKYNGKTASENMYDEIVKLVKGEK